LSASIFPTKAIEIRQSSGSVAL